MSRPIIIIFERHWDPIPKLLGKDLLPKLNDLGYDTLCFEAPQHLTSTELIKRHKTGLADDIKLQQQVENSFSSHQIKTAGKLSDLSFSFLSELVRQHASSQHYIWVATKIKQLPAHHILDDILNKATELSWSVKAIDSNSFDELTSCDLSPPERERLIKAQEDTRIRTMFKNLLDLQNRQEGGVVFVCGDRHAAGLSAQFQKNKMQNDILYYFPHSSSRFDDRVDDIELSLIESAGTLVDHTYLLKEQEIKPFSEHIVKEIGTRYIKEIPEGNSHTILLSNLFQTTFRAFVRPGYYVDALACCDHTLDIEKRLDAAGIESHKTVLNGQRFLVISNVNTEIIGNKIRAI